MGLRYFYVDKRFLNTLDVHASQLAQNMITDSWKSDTYLRQKELIKNPEAREYAVMVTKFPADTNIVDVNYLEVNNFGLISHSVKITVESFFYKNKKPKEITVVLKRKLIKGSRLVKPSVT